MKLSINNFSPCPFTFLDSSVTVACVAVKSCALCSVLLQVHFHVICVASGVT
jgi:hypothetical protein